MITLTPARFTDFCARFNPAFELEARRCATITPTAVEIPPACLAALQAKYPPLPRAHPAAPPKPRGLGDVVALFAEPIARASDAVLGTHLVGCNACAERRAALNKLVPDL